MQPWNSHFYLAAFESKRFNIVFYYLSADGPCALDFSKMKTPDSYWTDPTADELVQRHRIHSGLFQQTPAITTSSSRPTLGTQKSSYDENLAVAPLLAREHIESLHQNSHAALLYGKNNVYLEPVSSTYYLVP